MIRLGPEFERLPAAVVERLRGLPSALPTRRPLEARTLTASIPDVTRNVSTPIPEPVIH